MNSASTLSHAGLSPREITAASKSNFSLSFLFLPAGQRRGITNFYALSRVIDDAVDEAPSAEDARRQLQFWKDEAARCYEGVPTHPVSLAMQETIRDFHIPRAYLDWLVEGCEMDLEKTRYADFDELYRYCFRVAGVIGLISMKIFGLDGEVERKAAEELGLALQLTNILRDVAVDGEKGRIYLPQDELKKYGVTEDALLRGEPGANLKALLIFQADRAQSYFDRAFEKMRTLPRRPLVAAWIMGRVYQEILFKIRRKNYDVFTKKIGLSKLTKLRIALGQSLRVLMRY